MGERQSIKAPPFTEAQLRAAYVGENLTLAETAERLSTNGKLVAKMLKIWGIPAHPAAPRIKPPDAALALRRELKGTWAAMKGRCYDPKAKHYDRYGGRGIRVCGRWRLSLDAFIEDMGPRPPGMTLDRKENSGNYEPNNCRWATRTEQQNNRHNNVRVTWNGQDMTVTQLAQKVGMSPIILKRRIVSGMSPEDAAATPVKRLGRRRHLTEQEIDVVMNRLANGDLQRTIADDLRCDPSWVSRVASRPALKVVT